MNRLRLWERNGLVRLKLQFLDGTKISDKGLSQFKDFENTKVTDAGIEELRRLLAAHRVRR
jgi:hypothetical protein